MRLVMVFSYYHRLTPAQQAVYRASDAIGQVRLPRPSDVHAAVRRVAQALERGERPATERATRALVDALTERLGLPRVRVTVLAVRPADDYGELHGLYLPASGRRSAHMTVWMRTARRRQPVAFRTYLRTFLHELCHHLDYTLLKLPDSFHTEGFYKRETSLFRQLVPPERMTAAARRVPSGGARPRKSEG